MCQFCDLNISQYICVTKLLHMNKRGWVIPFAIVAVIVLAIVVRWSSLAELIPAHFICKEMPAEPCRVMCCYVILW